MGEDKNLSGRMHVQENLQARFSFARWRAQQNLEGTWLPALFFSLGFIWVFTLLLRSTGTPVQDEINHLLISLHAWETPKLMLHIWGRPANTIIFMPVAFWGLAVARFYALLLSAVTVWVTMRIGRLLGIRFLFLIPLLMWFQPWYSDLSYFAITEVPFSLYLVLGILFWLTRRSGLAGFFIGLLPLTRHEGILILGLWCFYLLVRRDFRALVISLLPYAGYNLVYAVVFHDWPVRIFFQPQETTFYGSGGWLHFVKPTIDGVGLPLFILALFSIPAIWQLKEKALLYLVFILYFAIHTVLYRFGLYASGGYALFLLPLAPGAALAGAQGFDQVVKVMGWLSQKLRLQPTAQSAAIKGMVLLATAAVIATGLQVKPYLLTSEETATLEASNWLKANQSSSQVVVSTHSWFHWFYGMPWPDGRGVGSQPPLETLGPGSIVVWDQHYSNRLGFNLDILSSPEAGWKELARFQDGLVIIFQKVQ